MAGRLLSLQLATTDWEATTSDPEFYIAGQSISGTRDRVGRCGVRTWWVALPDYCPGYK